VRIVNARGKQHLSISRVEWRKIGRANGWLREGADADAPPVTRTRSSPTDRLLLVLTLIKGRLEFVEERQRLVADAERILKDDNADTEDARSVVQCFEILRNHARSTAELLDDALPVLEKLMRERGLGSGVDEARGTPGPNKPGTV